MILAALPRLTLALMALPVLAGLAGTVGPALAGGGAGFRALLGWPGLGPAAALSLVTGLGSTLLALGLCLLLLAALYGTPGFAPLRRLLAPLLALPHAAAALALAFLVAPSGWVLRLVSPWATGWTDPPDLLLLNDPMGIALMLGLTVKELPFLLLMALAALRQDRTERLMTVAATLGHGRVAGFVLTVWPGLYPQLRLPVYAVLAYAMTSVDMAMILGPTLPPTLSQQVALWQMAPDLAQGPLAAAGALTQLALVLGALGLWRGAEALGRAAVAAWAVSGRRSVWLDAPARRLALATAGGLWLGLAAGIAALALWSVAAEWRFPDALPARLTSAGWTAALPGLIPALSATLMVALAASLPALVLVLGCLEAETRHGLTATPRAMALLYLPLLVPQIAFLPGLQRLALATGAEGTWPAVAAAHLAFVLPYVFLSLSGPYRGLDARLSLAGRSLGASEQRLFWRLRLPLLLAPLLTALAVGIAVSIGQYLPTLLIGGGRVVTVTTEAVALSSGGNRRVTGAFALLQMLLPALAFGIAIAVPRVLWRNRRGMRA